MSLRHTLWAALKSPNTRMSAAIAAALLLSMLLLLLPHQKGGQHVLLLLLWVIAGTRVAMELP